MLYSCTHMATVGFKGLIETIAIDLGLTSLASLTSLIASVTVSRRDSTVDQQPSTVNWLDDLKTVRKTNEAIVKF